MTTGIDPTDFVVACFRREGFCGCGALVSSAGHILSARHVLEPATHALVRREGMAYRSLGLSDKIYHERADLGLARITDLEWETKWLPIARTGLLLGDDVLAFGFVSLEQPEPESGLAVMQISRFRKGYLQAQTSFNVNFGDFPVYELSFEVLKGLSGSPLLAFRPDLVTVGILFGSGRKERVEDYVEIESEEGQPRRRLESRRIESAGLAVTSASILELQGTSEIFDIRP